LSDTTYLGARGFPQADRSFLPWQRNLGIALLIAVIVLTIAFPHPGILAVNATCTVFFLLATVYRIFLIDLSLRHRNEITLGPDDLLEPPKGEWPAYVIQVPLYKERHALPHLVEALSALDYPKDKLTIQLLVEADDEETRAALEEHPVSAPFVVVDIPVSYPRTKPKACNVGLAAAAGEYLVIYDAEDRPDPDQLKKAVVGFARCADNTACIQAKLNFYNTRRNLLTRCFTAEYAMWFDLCLPGLDFLRAPIPLGGTSNHFRLDVLKDLGGWDEYNVTEDCDLGLRLFQHGWRTRILDSTTWEEACPRLPWWLKQRSRWVKGYVQTWLVHTRHPLQLSKRLGLVNSLHFHLLIGGSVLSQLLAPFFWALVAVWIIWRPDAIGQFFPGPIFVMGAACLFAGTFYLVYASAIAVVVRGLGRIAGWTLLMPFYWFVMSIAAWKGALQLLWNPHYWEKTQHHAG
jgi:cellulose synthase/poly-beta-1,6-N-acetylglucosamine synthase-like glycosyltransferase